ncbi:aspartyl/glutamyl-tRNA(Asn/Gln) amidotransferase subunit C [Phycisphaera mikurensis NBRC 102666]|uniref:Aspartyl/glutamyl-tRNA(Asn/Gln) amidotransferase subunit C n=1 Tax=Phycisphaera mikurensis (strain NBRC 102666 / KCTC 22515 / FYK2301M01) TaxID=1142394 RepID=I0IET6_PHYMF|nr:aspartyl/glutamyl-tRNA(Asn/Gln) amidotransferase subunit C [Phycisphaera mikurensis NBRC 102666]
MTTAEVLHVAKLAKLRLTEREAEQFAHQLAGIVAHIDQLGEAEVEGVEPMPRPMALRNVFREDAVPQAPALGLGPDVALANAPAKAGPYFTVPRVLGGGGSA